MRKKISFLNDGCSGHRDIFRQLLKSLEKEYDAVKLPSEADVIILFSCGFTKWDVTNFLGSLAYISEVKKEGAIAIITGCGVPMYDREDLESLEFVDYVVEFDNCVSKICEILKYRKVLDYVFDDFPGKLILEITSGCYKKGGYCAFCKCHYLGIPVKTLLTVEEICELVRKHKVKILVLCGLNTVIYRDGENRLHDLLRKVSEIETLKWIDLQCVASSGIYPELRKEIHDNPKIFAVNYYFQSGSNRMLEIMNIGSTVEFNEEVLADLEGKCVSSAVVMAHPGEGVRDIKETKDFTIRNNLWYLDVFPYQYSVDTPSSEMKQIPWRQYWKHCDIIEKTVDRLAHKFLDNLIGKKVEGFIDSIHIEKDGKHAYRIRPLHFFGMINVCCGRIECEIGDTVSVEITKIADYHPATIIGKKMEVL